MTPTSILKHRNLGSLIFRRCLSDIDKFLLPNPTGDKAIDSLNRLVYAPLTGEDINTPEKSDKEARSKRIIQTARYYSSLVHKFPILLVMKSIVSSHKFDRTTLDNQIQDLNHAKNLEILSLNKNEQKVLDPNHLLQLYDLVELSDPRAFNIGLSRSKAELQSAKSITIPSRRYHVRFDPLGHYELLLLSKASLYLDPSGIFEILTHHRDSYAIELIRVNNEVLNDSILTAKNKRETLSYQNLLRYAKESHNSSHSNKVQDDKNYLQLFSKFGELGFVHSTKSPGCIYLTK